MPTINSHSGLKKILTGKRQRVLFVTFITFLVSALILITSGFLERYILERQTSAYKAGNMAVSSYYAEIDFSLLDKEAMDKKRAVKMALVHPVFVNQTEITEEVKREYIAFEEIFLKITASNNDRAIIDKELNKQFPDLFHIEDFQSLINHKDHISILQSGAELLSQMMGKGVFSYQSEDIGDSGVISILSTDSMFSEKIPVLVEHIVKYENLISTLRKELASTDISEIDKNILVMLVSSFAKPNTIFSESFTEQTIKDASSGMKPIVISIKKGDPIIEQGQIIKSSDMQLLRAIRDEISRFSFLTVFQSIVVYIVLNVVLFLFFRLFNVHLDKRRGYLLSFFTVVFLIIVVLVRYLTDIESEALRFLRIPVALFSFLIVQLTLSRRCGVIIVMLFSFFAAFFLGGGIFIFAYLSLSGITGCLIIRNVTRRIDMLKSGAFVGLMNLALLAILSIFKQGILSHYLVSALWAVSTGFFGSIIVIAILPVFEYAFNFCTVFRLIELSDVNVPIMRRMLSMAPGTHIHSLAVANMAEAATEAVGGNSLLARVGSLYHDIGKSDQPEYFIENQTEINKHDEMKPSLSASLIKSHVSLGVERAVKLKLPVEVVNIIQQHHGRSLILYFYDKAQKENGKGREIHLDDFRYDGPIPQTKEAAIVMLADVCEAATRTIKKPTTTKMEKMVWNLIIARFQEGELGGCDLTLHDLEVVKESFIQVLTGQFHTRIEYPEEQQNNIRKTRAGNSGKKEKTLSEKKDAPKKHPIKKTEKKPENE